MNNILDTKRLGAGFFSHIDTHQGDTDWHRCENQVFIVNGDNVIDSHGSTQGSAEENFVLLSQSSMEDVWKNTQHAETGLSMLSGWEQEVCTQFFKNKEGETLQMQSLSAELVSLQGIANELGMQALDTDSTTIKVFHMDRSGQQPNIKMYTLQLVVKSLNNDPLNENPPACYYHDGERIFLPADEVSHAHIGAQCLDNIRKFICSMKGTNLVEALEEATFGECMQSKFVQHLCKSLVFPQLPEDKQPDVLMFGVAKVSLREDGTHQLDSSAGFNDQYFQILPLGDECFRTGEVDFQRSLGKMCCTVNFEQREEIDLARAQQQGLLEGLQAALGMKNVDLDLSMFVREEAVLSMQSITESALSQSAAVLPSTGQVVIPSPQCRKEFYIFNRAGYAVELFVLSVAYGVRPVGSEMNEIITSVADTNGGEAKTRNENFAVVADAFQGLDPRPFAAAVTQAVQQLCCDHLSELSPAICQHFRLKVRDEAGTEHTYEPLFFAMTKVAKGYMSIKNYSNPKLRELAKVRVPEKISHVSGDLAGGACAELAQCMHGFDETPRVLTDEGSGRFVIVSASLPGVNILAQNAKYFLDGSKEWMKLVQVDEGGRAGQDLQVAISEFDATGKYVRGFKHQLSGYQKRLGVGQVMLDAATNTAGQARNAVGAVTSDVWARVRGRFRGLMLRKFDSSKLVRLPEEDSAKPAAEIGGEDRSQLMPPPEQDSPAQAAVGRDEEPLPGSAGLGEGSTDAAPVKRPR